MATLHTRLMKLEEVGPIKTLSGTSDAEIERFLRRHLGLAADKPVTDEMLEQALDVLR